MAVKTYIAAITEALDLALEKDKDALIFGEDVGQNGGVFRATDGLQAKYGEERVFNTPLAESGIGGMAIGLATQGFHPIMEIQFGTFIFEVFDSIAGQMSRTRYRFNNTRSNNIVVRTPYGIGTKTPEMHADSIEGLFSQIPGIRVVMPSNPADAKGLLLASIENNDPVIFLETFTFIAHLKVKFLKVTILHHLILLQSLKKDLMFQSLLMVEQFHLLLKLLNNSKKMELKLKSLTSEQLLLLILSQLVKQLKNWACGRCSRSSTYSRYRSECHGRNFRTFCFEP